LGAVARGTAAHGLYRDRGREAGMTYDEWIGQLTDLKDTMPDPDDRQHGELRRQMWERILAIDEFLFNGGPEPPAEWRPTVPDMTAEEKEAQRAKALEWLAGEVEKMGAMLDEMDAADAAAAEADAADSAEGDAGGDK
jgi:hypothetical protein